MKRQPSNTILRRIDRRFGRTHRAALLGALSLFCLAGSARGELTPESAEVLNAVKKGVGYLSLASTQDSRLGGKALIGLAILKATEDPKHPQVLRQAEQIKQLMSQYPDLKSQDIYSLGIAIIFLVNLDPQAYRPQIEALIAALLSRQKPHGGWGYPAMATGDTSMTQYAVLGLWEADRAGFESPVTVWENVCNWLLRTQDPSGGFGYQGIDPGNFNRVAQDRVRHSLTAGGLASLYLCQEHLGLDTGSARNKALPSVLKRVETPEQQRRRKARLTDKIDVKRLAETQTLGVAWFDSHWDIEPKGPEIYLHYYLYALERYESFRDAMGGEPESHPWYDQGARVLIGSQTANGSWQGMTGPATDTAFSVLFLVRSTKKTLARAGLGSGSLIAGRGIPKAATALRMRGGDIVASPLDKPAEQLLALMDAADDAQSVKAAEGFALLAEQADEETLNKHAVQLRKLAASQRPEARIAAVKGLGRARGLDNVPTLIYALTDPDSQVVTAAIEALRYISRQPAGSPGTVITDEISRKAAIDYWKNWYLSLRPEADLSDLAN